jgi:hypothetical protein
VLGAIGGVGGCAVEAGLAGSGGEDYEVAYFPVLFLLGASKLEDATGA